MAEKVFLAFGANLGKVEETFSEACRLLESNKNVSNILYSRLYKTEPWGKKDQPDFLNMVLKLDWDSDHKELANLCFQIEADSGRIRSKETRWGPRKLDIDLLVFGDLEIDTLDLTIPHPRMQNRRFVLRPIMDIEPSLLPPGWKQNVAETLEKCDDDGVVVPLSKHPWSPIV